MVIRYIGILRDVFSNKILIIRIFFEILCVQYIFRIVTDSISKYNQLVYFLSLYKPVLKCQKLRMYFLYDLIIENYPNVWKNSNLWLPERENTKVLGEMSYFVSLQFSMSNVASFVFIPMETMFHTLLHTKQKEFTLNINYCKLMDLSRLLLVFELNIS